MKFKKISSHPRMTASVGDDSLVAARYNVLKDLGHLEDTILSLKELLNDNMILYEDPVKFFVLVREFRQKIRSIDMPPELSFMISSSGGGNHRSSSTSATKTKILPPGSFQYLEALLVDRAE